jgi:hypothetical protein
VEGLADLNRLHGEDYAHEVGSSAKPESQGQEHAPQHYGREQRLTEGRFGIPRAAPERGQTERHQDHCQGGDSNGSARTVEVQHDHEEQARSGDSRGNALLGDLIGIVAARTSHGTNQQNAAKAPKRITSHSASVQPFCFTLSHALVLPPTYQTGLALGDVTLIPAFQHLRPRVQAIGDEAPSARRSDSCPDLD